MVDAPFMASDSSGMESTQLMKEKRRQSAPSFRDTDDCISPVKTMSQTQSCTFTELGPCDPHPASSSSSLVEFCRICHCGQEIDNPLISPCRCSGTLRFVHQRCLQLWLKSKDQKHCELCTIHFNMTTKTKPFKQWEKLSMTRTERRKIICSVTFHVVAITCVVWSLYVLIDRVLEEVQNEELEWPFWTKLIVIAIGFTGGAIFMYVQCKLYAQYLYRWRAYNRVIVILDSKARLISSSHDSCAGTTV